MELGNGLSNEIESPEFATVAGLIKGIPGSPSSENVISMKASRPKKNINVSKIFKKIQEFFDEL